MDAKAKRQVMSGFLSIDNKIIRTINNIFVAITRHVPHQHLIAFFNLLISDDNILIRGSSHIRQGRLPTDNFRYHICN